MKNIYSLLVSMMMVFGAVALTSCSGEEEELMDDNQITNYTEGIKGLWQCQETGYKWRFAEMGSGAVYGDGDRWKPTEIEEHDLGTDYFHWHFEELGLIIEMRQEDANGGYFYRANTESPYKVESMTAKEMVLIASDGESQHYDKISD